LWSCGYKFPKEHVCHFYFYVSIKFLKLVGYMLATSLSHASRIIVFSYEVDMGHDPQMVDIRATDHLSWLSR